MEVRQRSPTFFGLLRIDARIADQASDDPVGVPAVPGGNNCESALLSSQRTRQVLNRRSASQHIRAGRRVRRTRLSVCGHWPKLRIFQCLACTCPGVRRWIS